MAQSPLPQYFRKPYQDLSGGKCTRPDPQLVPANKFVQLNNAILADHDILEKAPGYTVDGSPFPNNVDSFIRMLVNYRIGTSINSLVVAAQDDGNTNATYKVDFKQTFGDGTYNYIGYTTGTASFTNGSANVTGTGTFWMTNLKSGDKIKPNANSNWFEVLSVTNDTNLVLTTVYTDTTALTAPYLARIILASNFLPVGLVFNNKLVITNGSEEMMEFDNTTMTRITGFNTAFPSIRPIGLEKYKNRLFAFTATTLYWSKVNDETTWDAASEAPIFPQDNGNIVECKSFANSILVFKDNGLIYQVMGEFDQDVVGAPTNIKRLDVPDNLGIIAGKTVVINDDNQLYFLSETGFYAIDPWYLQFKKVSWDIQPDIANLIFRSAPTSNKQFSFASQAQWNSGNHNGTRVTASNQLSTYNDRLAVVNNNLVVGPNYIAAAIDTNNKAYLATLGSSGGLTYPIYNEYGADLTRVQELPWFTNPTGWNASNSVTSLAIGVASNGHVGMAWTFQVNAPAGTTDASAYYTERVITGTASFTNGSNSVTGTGTSWQTGTAALSPFSFIKNTVDGTFAQVSTVNSDTSITLTAPYAGTTSVASAYQAWSTPVQISPNVHSASALAWTGAVALKFNGVDPRVLYVNAGGARYCTRTAGIYSNISIVSGLTDSQLYRASLFVNGANASASFTLSNTVLRAWHSTNDGATWTLLDNATVALTTQDGIQVSNDGSGNTITGFGDGQIKKRNNSTLVTTTLDSSSNSEFNGYSFYDGNDYAMNIVGLSPNQLEKYIFLTSSTVSSANPNELMKGYYPAQGGLDNNGSVFLSVAYGTNTNEVVIRRISFKGVYLSPILHDATLSAWGNYVVTGENDNGATVLQQIILSSTGASTGSPAVLTGTPATITSGTLISNDPTKNYVQFRVTATITALSAPVIQSIVLNYTGTGIDGKTPWSFIFNNEMYTSATQIGQSANNVVEFLDRKSAWGDTSIPATEFARMNQTLYAGSSLRGDVYKLKQGLDMAGSAYSLTAITKEDMMGSLELTKDVSKVYVLFRKQASGTFTFSYRTDPYKTVGGSAWVDKVIDQTLGGIAEVPIQKTASSIQFKITQADAGVQVGFIGFILLYGYLNLR